MAKRIEVGDVVRLNSGGPKMTVTEVKDDDDPVVTCAWFHQTSAGDYLPHLHTEDFGLDTLVLMES